MKNQSLENPMRFKATKALSLVLAIQMLFLNALPVLAVPVVHGDSTGYSITSEGPNAYVLQHNNDDLPPFGADISYSSFNISQGNTLRIQDGPATISIHRDKSGTFSSINGRLTANGIIYLLNPNGILFGSSAQVQVGGLVAAAMDRTTAGVFEGVSGDITFQSGANIQAASFAHFLGSRIIGRDLATINAPEILFGELGGSHADNQVELERVSGGTIRLAVKSASNTTFEVKGASLTITNLNLGASGTFTADADLTLTNGTMAVTNSLTLNAGTNLHTWSALNAGDDLMLHSGKNIQVAGNLTATRGNVIISNSGGLINLTTATVTAGSNINMTAASGGSITNVHAFVAGNDVNIHADRGMSNYVYTIGSITAGQNITMTSGTGELRARGLSLTAQNGGIHINGPANVNLSNLTAGTSIDVQSANSGISLTKVRASNNITLTATGSVSFTSSGSLTAINGSVHITAGGHAPTKSITAAGDVTVQAGSFIQIDGVNAGGNVLLDARGDKLQVNGPIVAVSNITLTTVSNFILPHGGSIVSTLGDIRVEAERDILLTNSVTAVQGALELIAGGDVSGEQGGVDAATLKQISGSNVFLNVTTGNRNVGLGLIAATNRLEINASTIGGANGTTGFYDANGDALNLIAGNGALLHVAGYVGTLADPIEMSITGLLELNSGSLTANDTPPGYNYFVANQTNPLPVTWKYIGESMPGNILFNYVPPRPVPPPEPEPEPVVDVEMWHRFHSAKADAPQLFQLVQLPEIFDSVNALPWCFDALFPAGLSRVGMLNSIGGFGTIQLPQQGMPAMPPDAPLASLSRPFSLPE